MKKRTKKPQAGKTQNQPRNAEAEKKHTQPDDSRKGFGILPDRDLKKNLGCG